VEHSLLGGTPEAAVKLRELEVQIAQKAARDAQAEKERQERISTEFAALKAADTAESSTKPTRQDFDHIGFEHEMVVTDTLSDELEALMAEGPTPAAMAAVAATKSATGTVDERIAALQQMAAKSKQMLREQAVLTDAMTTLGATLAAERSGVATPATPSSPRRRDAAVKLGVESQHALLHAADRIMCESLSSGGVSPVGQDFKDCRICAATKMRAPSVRQDSGPRPDAAAATHVCDSLGASAGPSCGAAPSE
jgi:hypothetical protein